MFAKRGVADLAKEFLTTYVISNINAVAGGLNAVVGVLKRQIDIAIFYSVTDVTSGLASDNVCETVYHELTYAALINKAGVSWYQEFVNAELYEIVANITSGYSPYGNGTNPTTSPIIALGESWAYHGGQYFADKRYRLNSSNYVPAQTGGFVSNLPPFSSHQLCLENFNPNYSADPLDGFLKDYFMI